MIFEGVFYAWNIPVPFPKVPGWDKFENIPVPFPKVPGWDKFEGSRHPRREQAMHHDDCKLIFDFL